MNEVLEALDRISIHRFDEKYEEWDKDYEIVENYLETIDNSKLSEALECLEKIVDKTRINDGTCCHWRECLSKNKCILHHNDSMCSDYTRANTIKQALIKSQEKEKELYVIYCTNNYHNIYMDYRGQDCEYSKATVFSDKLEAHKFLREKGTNNYFNWAVVNVKDLEEPQKWRNK